MPRGINVRGPGSGSPTADLRSELAEAGYTQVGLSVSYCELWTADEKFYRAASPVARSVHWIGEPAALG